MPTRVSVAPPTRACSAGPKAARGRSAVQEAPTAPGLLPQAPSAIPPGAGPHSGQPLPPLPLQRKLAVGSSDDPLEREADREADRVMGTPTPAPPTSAQTVLRRKCACEDSGSPCPECASTQGHTLQRKAESAVTPVEAPPIVHRVLRSPGQQLDTATRAFFEPRFGANFSDVRVHTDAEAEASAQAVQARAYTVGRNIVFGGAKYAPGTAEGNRVLAHELTHVVQQSHRPAQLSPGLRPHEPGSISKQQGESLGMEVSRDSTPTGQRPHFTTQPIVQRQPGNTQGLSWRELAQRAVPWQQWTMAQKEAAEEAYHEEIRKLATPADIIAFNTPPYQNEVKRLLAPYSKDMAAFQQLKTVTLLEPSATFVSTLQYESKAGSRVTLKATVILPTSANPNPPTGEVLFEIIKASGGMIDATRVQSSGSCVTTNNAVLGPSTSCTAKANYVTIPLSAGKYTVKATYQPLNTAARSSSTEVFITVK